MTQQLKEAIQRKEIPATVLLDIIVDRLQIPSGLAHMLYLDVIEYEAPMQKEKTDRQLYVCEV